MDGEIKFPSKLYTFILNLTMFSMVLGGFSWGFIQEKSWENRRMFYYTLESPKKYYSGKFLGKNGDHKSTISLLCIVTVKFNTWRPWGDLKLYHWIHSPTSWLLDSRTICGTQNCFGNAQIIVSWILRNYRVAKVFLEFSGDQRWLPSLEWWSHIFPAKIVHIHLRSTSFIRFYDFWGLCWRYHPWKTW